MAIREGLWDCTYCGNRGNRGPVKKCAACGVPRGEGVRFYLLDGAPEVTDPAAIASAGQGADWRCPYCGRDNPAGSGQCSGCGGVSDGSASRRPVEMQRFAPSTPYSSYPPPGPVRSDYPIRASGCLGGAGGCFRAGSVGCAVLLGLVVLVGGLGIWAWLQRTHDELVTVAGRRWERTIEIEQQRTVTEEAWEGSVPSGARRLSSWSDTSGTQRVRAGTRRVQVGTRDLGNGHFEDVFEDQPVYEERPVTRTRVRYEIDRWTTDRTLRESGADDAPRWPAVSLGLREREARRNETLSVLFRSESGEERTYRSKSLDAWLAYTAGTKYKGQINRLGEVKSLQRVD